MVDVDGMTRLTRYNSRSLSRASLISSGCTAETQTCKKVTKCQSTAVLGDEMPFCGPYM